MIPPSFRDYDVPVPFKEISCDAPGDRPDAESVLRELLECTELNLDELEDHTRAVIEKARALLGRARDDG